MKKAPGFLSLIPGGSNPSERKMVCPAGQRTRVSLIIYPLLLSPPGVLDRGQYWLTLFTFEIIKFSVINGGKILKILSD